MASGRPSVLVLNQYFEPDLASTGRYVAGIAKGLAERGFTVDVLTGEPSYTRDGPEAPRRESEGNLSVTRLPLFGLAGTTPFSRRLGVYLCYVTQGLVRAGWRLARHDYDVLLSFHNPPFLGALTAVLARVTSTPMAYAPLDVLPHSALEKFSFPGWFERFWLRAERWTLGQASAVGVLSGEMGRFYEHEFSVPREKLHEISLWALHRPEDGAGRSGTEDRGPLFLWSGNMGTLHRVRPFVQASREVERPHRMVFTGDGPRRDELEEAKSKGADQVILREYLPDDEYDALLQDADVGLIGLRPGASDYCVPSRALTFLASGLPVLVLCAGDNPLTRLVDQKHCGWHARSSAELVSIVGDLCRNTSRIRAASTRTRKAYQSQFSVDATIERFADLVTEAINRTGGRNENLDVAPRGSISRPEEHGG